MLHLASTTPGGTSRPLEGDLRGWVETTEECGLLEYTTPSAGGRRVVYIHVASGKKSYVRPSGRSSVSSTPDVLQALDRNSPRSSTRRKKQLSLRKNKKRILVSPPSATENQPSVTPSPVQSCPLTPLQLWLTSISDLSMVFSRQSPQRP